MASAISAASDAGSGRRPGGRRWTLDDIAWHQIRREAAAPSIGLFYLVASASLMESATDLYTANLVDYFAGDDEITSWLEDHWLPEELQHGRALRRYVEAVWPEFDWEAVNRRFVEEFKPFCDIALERVRGVEMASRCVVETGTASYYTTLSRISVDPVLSRLTRLIAEDEVRHYKHFYRYFRRYRQDQGLSRAAIAPGLWRRLRMTGGNDSFIVLKHVHAARYPEAPFDLRVYRDIRRQCRELSLAHFPHEMSVRMLLKPLALGHRSQRLALPVLVALARRVVP